METAGIVRILIVYNILVSAQAQIYIEILVGREQFLNKRLIRCIHIITKCETAARRSVTCPTSLQNPPTTRSAIGCLISIANCPTGLVC